MSSPTEQDSLWGRLKRLFGLRKLPPPCQHERPQQYREPHYNMIEYLDRFEPRHWPLNTREEIDRWLEDGHNVARVMQVHSYCPACGQYVRFVGHILQNPYHRTKEEKERSEKVARQVIQLIGPNHARNDN
jgi:hypothetical protein